MNFVAARVTRRDNDRERTKRPARQNEPQVGAGFIHAKLSPQIVVDVDQRALVDAAACRSVAIKGRATACANERSHTTTTTQKTTDKCIHSEHDEIKKHNKDESRAWLVLCEVVLPHATRHKQHSAERTDSLQTRHTGKGTAPLVGLMASTHREQLEKTPRRSPQRCRLDGCSARR